jgi:hypothetical protein
MQSYARHQARHPPIAAVWQVGHLPDWLIISGNVFHVEVDSELLPTRMEFPHFTGPMKGRELCGQAGEYYSCDGYHLRNGLCAAIGAD